MMQQHERLYQLDKPSPIRDADVNAPPLGPPQGPLVPPGWIGLEDCNLSPVLGHALVMPHVLLHPDIGVALIDVAPGETQGAEPAFRARLEAARFVELAAAMASVGQTVSAEGACIER